LGEGIFGLLLFLCEAHGVPLVIKSLQYGRARVQDNGCERSTACRRWRSSTRRLTLYEPTCWRQRSSGRRRQAGLPQVLNEPGPLVGANSFAIGVHPIEPGQYHSIANEFAPPERVESPG